jgi:hypothetical protein
MFAAVVRALPGARIARLWVRTLQILFHPSGSVLNAYDVATGSRRLLLRGHMATVNACAWSRRRFALLTGSTDRSMLAWSPAVSRSGICDVRAAGTAAGSDEDAWSSDGEASVEAPHEVVHLSGGRRLQPGEAAAPHLGFVHAADTTHNGRQHASGGCGARRVAHGGTRRRAHAAPPRIRRVAVRLIHSLMQHLPQSRE